MTLDTGAASTPVGSKYLAKEPQGTFPVEVLRSRTKRAASEKTRKLVGENLQRLRREVTGTRVSLQGPPLRECWLRFLTENGFRVFWRWLDVLVESRLALGDCGGMIVTSGLH
jgi:hypothetical protein